MNCKECKWADISEKERVIRTAYGIITQTGKNNVICKCPFSMSLVDGDCDRFERKERIEE